MRESEKAQRSESVWFLCALSPLQQFPLSIYSPFLVFYMTNFILNCIFTILTLGAFAMDVHRRVFGNIRFDLGWTAFQVKNERFFIEFPRATKESDQSAMLTTPPAHRWLAGSCLCANPSVSQLKRAYFTDF